MVSTGVAGVGWVHLCEPDSQLPVLHRAWAEHPVVPPVPFSHHRLFRLCGQSQFCIHVRDAYTMLWIAIKLGATNQKKCIIVPWKHVWLAKYNQLWLHPFLVNDISSLFIIEHFPANVCTISLFIILQSLTSSYCAWRYNKQDGMTHFPSQHSPQFQYLPLIYSDVLINWWIEPTLKLNSY